jgi:hypothetical protein
LADIRCEWFFARHPPPKFRISEKLGRGRKWYHCSRYPYERWNDYSTRRISDVYVTCDCLIVQICRRIFVILLARYETLHIKMPPN